MSTGKRGPLAATDKRRQAGHKRPRHVGGDDEDARAGNGRARSTNLFSDRRKNRNAEGKRAF